VRPRVILHNAVSADGRMEGMQPDIGLFYELAEFWDEDATLVGADTLLAAPSANGGPGPAPDGPLLVAVDSGGRLRGWEGWLAAGHWRAGISLCTFATPPAHLRELRAGGIETHVAGEERVDLAASLEWLRKRHDVATVRVDSGGTLNGALLREGLVDEISVLVHPALVGGTSSSSLFRAGDKHPIGLELAGVERFRSDTVWLRYAVRAQR
jgi:2,5-diamino-6-(ribosylamino)-4(3H)-pyrimidinone 5'-phosphate reductase